MTVVYVIFAKDWNSLEVAFSTVEQAQAWVAANGGRSNYSIIAVELVSDNN